MATKRNVLAKFVSGRAAEPRISRLRHSRPRLFYQNKSTRYTGCVLGYSQNHQPSQNGLTDKTALPATSSNFSQVTVLNQINLSVNDFIYVSKVCGRWEISLIMKLIQCGDILLDKVIKTRVSWSKRLLNLNQMNAFLQQ